MPLALASSPPSTPKSARPNKPGENETPAESSTPTTLSTDTASSNAPASSQTRFMQIATGANPRPRPAGAYPAGETSSTKPSITPRNRTGSGSSKNQGKAPTSAPFNPGRKGRHERHSEGVSR